MSKIRTFIEVFKNSIISPDYYSTMLKKTRFSFSIKYLLFLGFILSLISTAITGTNILSQINIPQEQIVNVIKDSYPADLEITIDKQGWEINQPQPYLVPIPNLSRLSTEFESQVANNFDYLVVLDKQGTIDDLEKYKTLFVINEKNVIARDEEGIRAYPIDYQQLLQDQKQIRFGMQDFTKLVDRISSFLRGFITFLPFLILFFVFTGFFIANTFFRFLYLLIPALILFIISRFSSSKLSYSESYRVALHTMTIPILIEFLAFISKFAIPLPFWFLTLNALIAIVILTRLKNFESEIKQ